MHLRGPLCGPSTSYASCLRPLLRNTNCAQRCHPAPGAPACPPRAAAVAPPLPHPLARPARGRGGAASRGLLAAAASAADLVGPSGPEAPREPWADLLRGNRAAEALAAWKPPRWCWRTLAALVLGGEVMVRILQGEPPHFFLLLFERRRAEMMKRYALLAAAARPVRRAGRASRPHHIPHHIHPSLCTPFLALICCALTL